MSDLIVVGFHKNPARALDVLSELRQLDFEWALHVRNAIAVYRDDDGTLRLERGYDLTKGQGARWGALWGSLLGAIVAMPFTAGASAAAAATAAGGSALFGAAGGAAVGAIDAEYWQQEFALDSEFVREVSTMIRPGDSAILALVATSNRDLIARHFAGYGGTVLSSSLTPEQETKLQGYLLDQSMTR